MRIIETDNFGGDYPNESFLNLPSGQQADMARIVAVINVVFCKDDYATRYWKVVPDDYVLQPGFEQ